jgi:hypothetical protein
MVKQSWSGSARVRVAALVQPWVDLEESRSTLFAGWRVELNPLGLEGYDYLYLYRS